MRGNKEMGSRENVGRGSGGNKENELEVKGNEEGRGSGGKMRRG